ncbi:MAG TPA: nuclear transport factor 2 family protein [Polyangiaceae bacterium]|nr:nuclear transport factor 2 family protein [Polyangiaceae bacterium]
MMTREEAEAFAVRWTAAWNSGAAETVLAHFHPDVVFTSPTALAVVGSATVRGKDALRAYWLAAMARGSGPRFTLDRVLWDPMSRELVVLYASARDGQSRCVAEILKFDEAGWVMAGEVFHGVPGPS